MCVSAEFFYFFDRIEVRWIFGTSPEDAEVVPTCISVLFQPIKIGRILFKLPVL